MSEAATIERAGARVYALNTPFDARAALKRIGCHWDADRRAWWIGAAKAAELEKLVAGLAAAPAADAKPAGPSDDSIVRAKVKYKGRTYFSVAEAAGRTRCLITTLDGSWHGWVDMAACELVKEYHGREERGAYGRPTGRTVYTTLGSIRRFVEEQRAAEAKGVPACAECGKRDGNLIEDLEDGLMKHKHCCDIPSE